MADEAERVRQWRAQLALEQDSSDDDDHANVPSHQQLAPRQQLAPARVSRGPPGAQMPVGPSAREEMLEHKISVVKLTIEERDLELEEARARAAPPSGGGAVDARDAKIKDLAKRLKTVTMTLGRERAQSAQLAGELAKLRRAEKAEAASKGAAAQSNAAGAGASAGASESAARESAKELKELRAQLSAASTRLHEQKCSSTALKADLQRYQRALSKEVGDEVAVAKLLDEGSGFKGRAQQIALLKEQLREANRKVAAASGVDGAELESRRFADDRQRHAIKAMEEERRGEAERLMLREQQLLSEVSEARKRGEAHVARIKNLEADVRSKREKLKVMLDKSDTDDQLIRALQAELANERARASPGGGASPGRRGDDGDAQRVRDLGARISVQQAQIDRQEQIIVALNEQARRDVGPGCAEAGDATVRHPRACGRRGGAARMRCSRRTRSSASSSSFCRRS